MTQSERCQMQYEQVMAFIATNCKQSILTYYKKK
ncbi:hypothetical protein SAMN05216462_1759 [Xylanibacter ruminicola]|uniref:Uncharacterized protein n=1 Tax=Xylanibacter ruminicola TaxID=839 RepID=A0A1H4C429_XYLRU|nr:hypothetical protein SAMN05216462_1759 [Xylanibacter ruminicola]